MSKPKSTAKLLNLPEEQQGKLADWLLSGMPYHQAREVVRKEFGVEVASSAPFSYFWERVCTPMLLARRARAIGTADAVATQAAAVPGRFDAATIDALKQRAFDLAISPGVNSKDVKEIFSLVLKARDQDLEDRRIKVLEDKARQAEAAETATGDSTLSPEEYRERMREIFAKGTG